MTENNIAYRSIDQLKQARDMFKHIADSLDQIADSMKESGGIEYGADAVIGLHRQ